MYALCAHAGPERGPDVSGEGSLWRSSLVLPVRGVGLSFSLFRAYRAVPLPLPPHPGPELPEIYERVQPAQ